MENNTDPKNKPKVKKVWQKPDFNILATDDIQTGNNPRVHEASFTAPNRVPALAPNYSAWYGHGHTKGFYYS